jgi:hypothetical protein
VLTEEYGSAPIMEDISNQTVLTGTNVTFSCRIVMSDSQPLLQWLRHFKKNDSYVNEKGEPYVKTLKVNLRFLTSLKIRVINKLSTLLSLKTKGHLY